MENVNGHNNDWISFQKDINNDEKILMKPTLALLEPVELNDIPTLLDVNGEKPNLSNKVNSTPNPDVIFTLPPPPRVINYSEDIPRTNSTIQYQKSSTTNSDENEEIILQVPNSAKSAVELNNNNNNQQKIYKNGQLLTTVFPSNSYCAWLIPPHYDCKIPIILTNKQNSLPSATYATILSSIVSDLRFFSYSVLYSRITPLWLIFSIIILLAVLASSPSGGFPIMIFALVWLIMLVLGLILCVLIRKYIVLSLRNLFKDVNKIAFQNKILVGVQDKGQLSCHKVALMFIYYDPTGCKEDTLRLLRQHSNSIGSKSLCEEVDLMQKAEELIYQFSQEYAKAYMKRRFLFPTRPSEGVSEFRPKHCDKNLCICQYIEREHFNKDNKKKAAPWYERVFAV